ncbi:MAG: hypothetical protein ABL961_17140 [Vicinamibacterales bacterium]
MVIKASSGTTVDALIAELSSTSEIRRDAAVARLSIIGERASQRLLNLAGNQQAPADARIAAFRALDAVGEPRALEAALMAIDDAHPAVAVCAAGVARAFLHTAKGVSALDRLSETATNPARPSVVRVAAIHALATLHSSAVQPLLQALRVDPDPAIVEAATGTVAKTVEPVQAAPQALLDAAERALPDDPIRLRENIVTAGSTVPVTVLHRIVEHVRIREGAESGGRRAYWMAARATAHAALAQRGSRLALYDLRETIESAKGPLAVDFMTALTAIGDVNCLEPIAAAYAAAAAPNAAQEDWWHRGLADAFRAIVIREELTRRHAVLKRVEKRFPGLFNALVR